MAVDELEVMRWERDARAAYAVWLESHLGETLARAEAATDHGAGLVQQLEASARHAEALEVELDRVQADYRALETWAHALELAARTSARPGWLRGRWSPRRWHKRLSGSGDSDC